jgi:endonuclease/exonuclease/phosphatase family metal-dependent hydrolase
MYKWLSRRNKRFNIHIFRYPSCSRGLKVTVISWNHGSSGIDCRKIIRKGLNPIPDVFVFASSECGGTIPDVTNRTQPFGQFIVFLKSSLSTDFILLHSSRIQGIGISIWIRKFKGLQANFKLIHSFRMDLSSEGTGRKGATGAVILTGKETLTFVSVHLNAHINGLSERIYQLRRLIDKSVRESPNGSTLFIMGDLNFRVESVKRDAFRSALLGDVDELLLHDQLSKIMTNHGQVFEGWHEPEPPAFLPTYKVERNRFGFDIPSGRTPSYTDRVLVRNQPPLQVTTIEYSKSSDSYGSDHCPILARFIVSSTL